MNELLKPPLGVGQTQPPPAQWANNVAYSDSSLAADLRRLSDSWRHVQSSRRRDAIFSYMTDVFELVRWWAFEKQADERAARALALKGLAAPNKIEPYRAVIVASVALNHRQANSQQMVKGTAFRSDVQAPQKRLRRFINGQGGINACASAYSRWLRRRQFRFCKE